jgi:hypothetical protein
MELLWWGLGGKRTGGYRPPESNRRQHSPYISQRVIHYFPYNIPALLFFIAGGLAVTMTVVMGFTKPPSPSHSSVVQKIE